MDFFVSPGFHAVVTFLFFNSRKVVLVKDFLVKHLKLVLSIRSSSYFGTHPVNFYG